MLSSVIALVAMGVPSVETLGSRALHQASVGLAMPWAVPGELAFDRQEAPAQGTFTLAEAIALGEANSPRILAARLRIEAARGRLLSARSMEPPVATIGPTLGGESVVPVLTQKFEISGRRGARTAVAVQDLKVAELQLATVELDLARDIRTAFAGLDESQAALGVASDVERVIERIRDSVRKQVDVGQLPAQELVKSEIELAKAQMDSVRAQSALDRARYTLNETLARPSGAPIAAKPGPEQAPVDQDLDALVAEALASRPEILAAEARSAGADANVGLQRSDLKPDLDLSLLANTDLKSPQFLRPSSVGLGLTLAFPLFDTGRIKGRVLDARAEAQALSADLEGLRLRVPQEVADALSRVKTAQALVTRYEQDILPGAADLLAKAEFGYGRGALTLLDFLEAQRTHKSARFDYLAAMSQYAVARADLDRAVGRGPKPAGETASTRTDSHQEENQ